MGRSLHIGPWLVEPDLNSISCDGQTTHVEPKAMHVLLRLADNAGETISKDEIIRSVWSDTFVGDDVLSRAIYELRKAFQDNSHDPQIIQTIAKRGYRLIAPVGTTEPVRESVQRSWLARHWKILAATTALIAIAGATFLYIRRRPLHGAMPPIQSLAVLPLENLSGDPQQEYFADGMTEALITDLSKIKALKVISRTSVMRYKGVRKPLPEIARELGVEGIVEGAVVRSGDRVRITAQLIEARSDRHLWAESYERDLRDVLVLQGEVARNIAAQVQVTLKPEEKTRLTGDRPVNVEAYNAYLQGRYLFGRGSAESRGKAIQYYEQALKLDPGYASAWASLAQARGWKAAFYGPTGDFEQARQEAERALALDPNLAQAHAALASIQVTYDWDWNGADASVQNALLLVPGDTEALGMASSLGSVLGRCDQALTLCRRAVELSPLDPGAYLGLADAAWRSGRTDEAAAAISKTLELNPQQFWSHSVLVRIYLAQSRPQQALLEMERETHSVFRLQGQALAYHALGRKAESDAALAELIAKWRALAAYQIAEVYGFRGESDQAFRWLEIAYSQRDSGLPNMKCNPLLKNLRSDPRYAVFLKKMRLPL